MARSYTTTSSLPRPVLLTSVGVLMKHVPLATVTHVSPAVPSPRAGRFRARARDWAGRPSPPCTPTSCTHSRRHTRWALGIKPGG